MFGNTRDVIVVFATAVFSVSVSLAWSNTFQSIFEKFYDQNSWRAKLAYSVTITTVGIIFASFIVPRIKPSPPA